MRVAVVGGGPSCLFLLRALVEAAPSGIELDVYEAGSQLGAGMPYSSAGSGEEHVTNVSGNEIPELVDSLTDWIASLPTAQLERHGIDLARVSDFKVVPRLLFGEYLRAQFGSLLDQAQLNGMLVRCHLNTRVSDIADDSAAGNFRLTTPQHGEMVFDRVILCTGHVWPKRHEGRNKGYFDSPYPPQKLAGQFNHSVAIRGSSLTAIDAVRTLARSHGNFVRAAGGKLAFERFADCPDFKIVLHSREGILPGIRFHLEDPHLSKTKLLSEETLQKHMAGNDGFVSLDYLFEHDFKAGLREDDPAFFEFVRDMQLEEFVAAMMRLRWQSDAFAYFKQEYAEALQSIRSAESIYWKEKLAVLSYAMNYPTKYFSAEDRLRLQNVLMPLISIVIAFTPQSSCEQLIALHDADAVEIVAVGSSGKVEPQATGGVVYHYQSEAGEAVSEQFPLFIDCIGQAPLSFEEFPFPSLVSGNSLTRATLKFRSAEEARKQIAEGNDEIDQDADGNYLLVTPGVAIDDNFNAIGPDGEINERLFLMAVPLIAGYNPDYSGLDFCEAASNRIVARLANKRVST